MIVKNVKQLMDKTKNIPILLDWERYPNDKRPKIQKAVTPSEALLNTTENTVIQEHLHLTRMSRRLKRTPVNRHEDFCGKKVHQEQCSKQ